MAINWRKISLYILLAFGFSWTAGLLMKIGHIEYGSIPSLMVIAGLYMPGPALATFIIQKFIYKEDFKQYGWTFCKEKSIFFLYIIFIFVTIILLSFFVVWLFGNMHIISQFGQVDFSQNSFDFHFKELLISKKININNIRLPNIPSWLFFIVALLGGIIAGATVNLPFTFGEEFGWRGLMLRETQQLGFIKSNLLIGTTWGIWHLPLILMGHNYPHHPHVGIIMMCFVTIALAPIFAYVRLKTKSILGACFLHGMVNATAALFILYVTNANELYGSITGWAGIITCIMLIIFIYIFDKQFVANYASIK